MACGRRKNHWDVSHLLLRVRSWWTSRLIIAHHIWRGHNSLESHKSRDWVIHRSTSQWIHRRKSVLWTQRLFQLISTLHRQRLWNSPHQWSRIPSLRLLPVRNPRVPSKLQVTVRWQANLRNWLYLNRLESTIRLLAIRLLSRVLYWWVARTSLRHYDRWGATNWGRWFCAHICGVQRHNVAEYGSVLLHRLIHRGSGWPRWCHHGDIRRSISWPSDKRRQSVNMVDQITHAFTPLESWLYTAGWLSEFFG